MTYQAELLEKLRSCQALIGIVGLGYVGLPLSLTYADVGYRVLGLDIDQAKADAINQGQSYIEHIDGGRVSKAKQEQRFEATVDFSRAAEADALIPENWATMSEANLRKHLMKFRGIGPWTAEMMLMFVLLKPDVFSPGDIGLVRAIQRMTDGVEDGKDAEAFAQRWAPWRTAASWFLWRTIDAEPVAY